MTLSDLRAWLSTLADAHALVPAAEVLERLPVLNEGVGVDPLVALDVDAAGEVLGRSSSTVREYCRRELLPGAFRQRGREWRIPLDAIRAFQATEAKEAKQANGAGKRQGDTDLSSWRKEIPTS
jgi:hypothetical protein